MPPARPVDGEQLREPLTRWLAGRLGPVAVGQLMTPSTGASNGTYLFEASTAAGGRTYELVLRVQPTENQFLDPDVLFQSRVMRALAGRPGIRVPVVLWEEPDSVVIGAPFVVMERVAGRVLPDSHHETGWALDLDAGQRSKMYESTAASLAALHLVAIGPELEFLRREGTGSALERHVAWLVRWHQWAARGRHLEIIDDALAFVVDHCPPDPSEGIVWGDARPGNMVFGDDLEVAAVLDWELAATGPPGIDLGWWLMFEESQTTARGIQPLDGVPDEATIVSRYRQAGGVPVDHLDFYKTLAALQFAIIVLRYVDLQVSAGHLPAETTMGTRSPITAMLADRVGLEAPPQSPDYEAVLRARAEST